jgi:RNA polymerase sigma factor (sigma-70 family)
MNTAGKVGNSRALYGRRGGPKESIRRLFGTKVKHSDIAGDRELELVRLARAGDRDARHVLDQAHLPLVYSTVRRYFGHGVDEEDLIQEGRMGLQHAVEKFDESFGVKFATYAAKWVRARAALYLSEHCADIRVTPKTRAAYGRMVRRGGRIDDLAASPDVGDRTLLENIAAVLPALSLDMPVHGAGRDAAAFSTLGDLVPGDGLPQDEAVARARAGALRGELVARLVAELPPREREVVVRRYLPEGRAEPETQHEIALSFGHARGGKPVTRQRIQQIEKDALARIAAGVAASGRLDEIAD